MNEFENKQLTIDVYSQERVDVTIHDEENITLVIAGKNADRFIELIYDYLTNMKTLDA
jgi:helix-turn-helix protein